MFWSIYKGNTQSLYKFLKILKYKEGNKYSPDLSHGALEL